MKVKELIKYLKAVDGDRTVFIAGEKVDYVDFSGVSYDDNGDIQLYEVSGDKPA